MSSTAPPVHSSVSIQTPGGIRSPVAGALTVVVDDRTRRERVRLDTPATGLLIPPLVWIETEEWTDGAVLLMLASARHDPADYIRDYSGLAAREP